MLIHIIIILFKSVKCIIFIGLFIQKTALHAGGQEFESPNLHHLKQLERLKSEPTGSFLMLSIHLSFEEIMADLNSAKPTSAISFLASFTRFSIVANGSCGNKFL